MTKDQAKLLAPGLYRLHWKSGGWSLASVGITHDGTRWFAPSNWTSQVPDVRCSEWRAVEHVDALNVENVPSLAIAACRLADAADHCRMCRECGDGPCCNDCDVEAATVAVRALAGEKTAADTTIDARVAALEARVSELEQLPAFAHWKAARR